MKNKQIWFIVGSQKLYGEEVLRIVDNRGKEMAQKINDSSLIPCNFVYKATVKTAEEITELFKKANYDDNCFGIVVWCHTFSPSKMWINGFKLLQKPYCHFATQYNREIPDKEIDMDFMNLNQAAHGDREHGYIAARLRLSRKIIMGYWQDESILKELGEWMRSAAAFTESQSLKVVRFGDNMREVAVTEGDKVEAQIKFGWQVNTWGVGDLVNEINNVTDKDIEEKMVEYKSRYEFATDNIESVRYQAKEEIAIRKILDRENAKAYTNTFEDLYGMEQLPGIASQNLLYDGYGYGAEGDWKVSAMTYVVKAMTEGMKNGSSFIEDYTYHLEKGNDYSLGAHMLEVCPSVAAEKPRIEVHPLGIGGKKDPARLVFEGRAGKGIVATLIDMGDHFRLIVQDIEVVKPIMEMPNLPVARIMWRATPDLTTGAKLWILAGGAHHSVLSLDANAQMMEDWAEMMNIEFVHITKDTTVEGLKMQLKLFEKVF